MFYLSVRDVFVESAIFCSLPIGKMRKHCYALLQSIYLHLGHFSCHQFYHLKGNSLAKIASPLNVISHCSTTSGNSLKASDSADRDILTTNQQTEMEAPDSGPSG